MKINSSIYGNSNQWLSPTDSTGVGAEVKCAYFGESIYSDNTWHTAVTTGLIPDGTNDIDLSISPWAIGRDAWFNSPSFAYPSNNGDGLVDALSTHTDTPIIIAGYQQGGSNGVIPNRSFVPNATASTYRSSSYFNVPFTSFNYNKIIGVAILEVSTEAILTDITAPTQRVYVNKYFDTSHSINYETYPIITAGYMVMYAETLTPVLGNKRSRMTVQNFFVEPTYKIRDASEYNYDTYKTTMNAEKMYLTNNNYTGGGNFSSSFTVFGNNVTRGYGVPRDKIMDTFGHTFAYNTTNGENNCNIVLAPAYTPTFRHSITTTSGIYVLPYWKNLLKEEILKQFAYIGFWFTDDIEYIQEDIGINCTVSNVYAPVFDSKGVTTGEYKAGIDAATLPNAEWNSPYDDNKNYNPIKKVEGDEDIKSGVLSYTFKGLTSYVLTNGEFDKVNKVVNTITNYSDTKSQWYDIDPANFITAVHFFPFPLTPSTLTDFVLGTTDFELNGEKLQFYTGLGVSTLDFGSLFIQPYYNDFRDFAPYTTYTLYIPFIGTYEVDPLAFVGHYMTLKFTVDHTTHSYNGLIYRDNFVYDYLHGSIGMSIPMTAVNQGQYSQAMAMLQRDKARLNNSSFWDTASSVSQIINNGINGDIAGVSNSFISAMGRVTDYPYQMYGINYALEHTKPAFVSVSNSNGAYNLQSDRYCRIIIQRHYTLPTDVEIFGTTMGFACNISDILSNVHGYTIATNITFNSADFTSVEENLIRAAFSEGVILP